MDSAVTHRSGKPPESAEQGADKASNAAVFGLQFVRKHFWRILLVFVGVLLPLWGFGALVEILQEGETFAFDLPLQRALHALSNSGLDRAFVLISALGYAWGVIPVDVFLILGLAWKRRFREGLFAGFAIGGSLALTWAAKHTFARARPALWQPLVSESTFSFPSGHAMGSMTLIAVLILLCWNLRSRWGWSWRWPVTVAGAIFVVLVGLSRVYLGVHYPSDILAGWAAASAWVVGIYCVVFYGSLRPWRRKRLE